MNRIKIKRPSENKQITLLSIFIFFAIFEPAYFREIEWLHSLYFAYKLIVYSIVAVLFIVQKWKISTITFFVILFCLEPIVVTYINHNDYVYDISKLLVPVLVTVLFFENCRNQDACAALKGLVVVHAILIYVNFMTVLLYSEGLYEPYSIYYEIEEKYYFLGHNNQAARYLVPGMFYSILYDYIKYNRIRWQSFLLAFIAMTTVVLTWSNTGMVGCAILLGYMIFPSKLRLPRLFFSAKIFLGISIGLTLLFVVFRMQDMFAFIIEDFFGKDMSLTGRTILWDAAMLKIYQSPVWGHGYGEAVIEAQNITDYVAYSTHNFFLDMLLRGGFTGLFLMLIIVFLACWRLDTMSKDIKIMTFSFTLLAYFVMWQTEVFDADSGLVDMILIFVMAYNIKNNFKMYGKN